MYFYNYAPFPFMYAIGSSRLMRQNQWSLLTYLKKNKNKINKINYRMLKNLNFRYLDDSWEYLNENNINITNIANVDTLLDLLFIRKVKIQD